MTDDFVENTLRRATLDYKIGEVEDAILNFQDKLNLVAMNKIEKASITLALVEMQTELRNKILLLEIIMQIKKDID